ncbi:MAG: hypothetical protein FK731_01045 [Asgard group archaeon]|nr:hypothetical protein [Asgard group archaeon]
MNLSKRELKAQERYKKAFRAKRILMLITYITAILFLGLIVYILARYGIAATDHVDFEDVADILSIFVGIPMFSVTVLSGISIGIINLIMGAMDEEGTTKEFKLIGKEEEL